MSRRKYHMSIFRHLFRFIALLKDIVAHEKHFVYNNVSLKKLGGDINGY
jgi:hypothetical protein